jgi:hypothetical protein
LNLTASSVKIREISSSGSAMTSGTAKDWSMSPRNLWVVWGKGDPDLVKIGWREGFYHLWVIAEEGEEGLAQIRTGLPNEFLAAMPLELLLHAEHMLDLAVGKSKGVWPAWLTTSAGASFCLASSPGGGLAWYEKKSTPDDATVMLEGGSDDLGEVIQEGRKILEERNYRKVLSDTRPVADGHPYDWLRAMRNPGSIARIRAMMAEAEE